ncbi:MAG: thiamine biosynthesis lipoprotein [Planctomycetota bacterium]|jgi:thiamine biosynthesis lipoprotein
MGTLFHIVLFAESEELGDDAANAAFQRIAEIEAVATDYDAASEARRLVLTVGEWAPVSDDLGVVIRAADAAWRASGGAFDATVGPVSRLWRRALRRGEWPNEERWTQALTAVGWMERMQLREVADGLEVRLDAQGMRLDFGGVAKGVAVDEACLELARHGIQHALIDGGGDLAAMGPPPGEPGWKIAVRPFGDDPRGPTLRFLLSRGAIATSGDAYQAGWLAGTAPTALQPSAAANTSRFGHILDPRTWQPLPGPRAAVMTAGSAAKADALATALTVLGASWPDAELYEGFSEEDARALRSGIFFPSLETEACVGRSFPHDGMSLLKPHPASSEE